MEGAVGTLADARVAHKFVLAYFRLEQRPVVGDGGPVVAVVAVGQMKPVGLSYKIREDVGHKKSQRCHIMYVRVNFCAR